jgi:hypothetical protein
MIGAHASRNAGHKYAQRKLRGPQCQMCGSSQRLQVHHNDRNPTNNAPENVRTLCARCHRALHIAAGDWGRGTVQPAQCPICESTFKPKRSRRKLCGRAGCIAESGRRAAERRWRA